MGNPVKKKRRDSSSSSSDSNSDSDSSSVKEKKSKKQRSRSSSHSDESDNGKKQKEHKSEKLSKEEINDKIKKHKYDEVQKSKWDSPAENMPRRMEKDTKRRYTDKEDNRDSRKHHDRSNNERRDDYRKHDREEDDRRKHRDDERRYKDDARDDDRRNKDRYNKDRGGRHDRRQNEDRYRQDRRRSRDRSRSRDRDDDRNDRRDNRQNFRYRGNRRPKFNNSEENENYDWGKKKNEDEKKAPTEREKPNFGLSGKLTEDTNTYRGIVIKYSEPPEARKPKRRWRLYPFKGEKALPTLYIHRESAYLMGRERKVVDFPLDHPSCSKQHAVLQYRLVPFTRENGTVGKKVRPYLIDLDSANGTYINNKRIEARKYYELLEKDVIKFGYSTREYVLLHENSKDEAQDDDVKVEDEEQQVKEEPQE